MDVHSLSNALVPYRGSTTVTTTSYASNTNSLISARYFTAQTGHALATELLYRLLFDILNRLLASLHRFAGRQFDKFSSFLETRSAERQKAIEAAREAATKGKEGLRISDEVNKAAMERGFIGRGGVACPMTGNDGNGRGRPMGWIGYVLDGIQEGRIVEKDFWGGHPFQN